MIRLSPISFVTDLFNESWKPHYYLILAVAVFACGQISLLVWASWYEETGFLPGTGKGLFEHYGVWAIVTTDPLLLISAGVGYRQFRNSMNRLPLVNSLDRTKIYNEIILPKIEVIQMKGNSKYFYILLVIVGIFSLANNIRNTMNPTFYYGNDVFDSSSYLFGFLINKGNLALSWVFVYPLVGFVTITLSGSLFLILREMNKRNFLKAEILHPDQCFGFARLGVLNIILLVPYFLTYEVMFFLSITHEQNYLSLIFPLIVTTILFLVVSFVIMFPLLRFLWLQNGVLRSNLESNLEHYRKKDKDPPLKFALNILLINSANISPYSKSARYTLVALRMIPVVMTAYKLFTFQADV